MRLRLLSACAVPALVFGFAASAAAQDAPAPRNDVPEEVDPNQIVVTAQGRAQALADVPLAISAVTAESLSNSGANDIRQMNQLAPSLMVSSTGSEANGSARVRGIGTVGDNPGLESSVAVFIDGVYRSRSGIGLSELGEVERVEVLRGPQGTLFGRNASAGLIHVVSKAPSFNFGGTAEASYGNFDMFRLSGSVTGPLTETIAARIDGVFMKRDGFYRDPANNTDVNNRNRWFVRGQLLFQPSSDLSVRVIGDYTKRKEACCGAVFVTPEQNAFVGRLNEPAVPLSTGGNPTPNGNNIINVMRDLGQNLNAYHGLYNRTLSVTPGRSYRGSTEDRGISVQADYNFGRAKLTSITAYRAYDADQAADLDYSSVDILYRPDDGRAKRSFDTFSQELRLQGTAFEDKLDWLVGGFFADEKLNLGETMRFGNQYGRFATCRLVSGSGLAALYSPTSAGCVGARPALFGAASPAVFAALNNLDGINNKGSTLDQYRQHSQNYAFFTHNIFHVTSRFDVTVGLRYTRETKKFSANFGNDNQACVQNQALLGRFIDPNNPAFNTGLFGVSNSILGLSCQGNSTAELNGVRIADKRSEGRFTGTAVLSWKPLDDLMLYASYSRGYKAGGFNLDRSALKAPTASFASAGGAQALVRNLQFDAETVNAYEVGAKWQSGPVALTLTGFRQEFKNFQLNTFDGTVFIVQNVNGCRKDLGGADRDQSVRPGASNFVNPTIVAGRGFNLNPAATTGACAASDVSYGVRSQGVEFEASLRPRHDMRVNLGITYADTRYRNNLVGGNNGSPLNPALRKLPGAHMSNAPEFVATASYAWTPELGSSGLSGLFYVDSRLSDRMNTGSDLFPQKVQESFVLVNGRIGIRGPNEKWALEVWGQNLLNKNYAQVAFNSPFQEGSTGVPPFAVGSNATPFIDGQYPGGRQTFSQYLAEPRTYGVTLRSRF